MQDTIFISSPELMCKQCIYHFRNIQVKNFKNRTLDLNSLSVYLDIQINYLVVQQYWVPKTFNLNKSS